MFNLNLVGISHSVSKFYSLFGSIRGLQFLNRLNPLQMNPIEISSSDTDSEFDSESDDENPEIIDPPTTLSFTSRHLADWSSNSTSPNNATVQVSGNGERCQKDSTTNRETKNHERLLLPCSSGLEMIQKPDLHQSEERDYMKQLERRALPSSFHSSATPAKPPGNRKRRVSTRSSGSDTMQIPDLHHSEDYSRTGQLGKVPNIDYEIDDMKQSERRALPSSFHPSATKSKLSRNGETLSEMNASGRPYHAAGSRTVNHQNFMKDNMINLDHSRSRVLPASLGHRVASFRKYPDPSDNSYPSTSRNGEEVPDETSIYHEVVQDLNQPKQEYDLPDGLLSVPLLRHQKISLAWMLQKETRINCVGGILADDQGLGKTVSTIALIQLQRFLDIHSKFDIKSNHNAEALNLDIDDDKGDSNFGNGHKKEDSEVISSDAASSKQRPAAGTLIVCPASVLRQWSRELNDKVDREAKLNTLVYHGSNRTKDPLELAKYDVILTTYAIVKNEVPKQPVADADDGEQKKSSDLSLNNKRKKFLSTKKGKKKRKGIGSCSLHSDEGALAGVRWLRVVLDEAQTIKNHRTQVARACYGLRAKRRWCLSGTPIQNSVDELFSYFKFLKYDPYSSYKAFCETIKAPISRDSDKGYKKLQIILKNVMLRRTKDTKINGEPIINLPPKSVDMRSVNFTMEERAFYSKLEADSRSQFKAYTAAGTVSQNYANILLMLLRLRQACDHPFLAYGLSSETFKNTASMQILEQCPKDMLVNLLGQLESSPICQACQDTPEDAVVTMCGHVFCYQCLLDRLDGDDITCPAPLCKEQLSSDVVFSKASIKSCLSDGSEGSRLPNSSGVDGNNHQIFTPDYSSSKIKAAVGILKSLNNPSNMCVDLDGLSKCDGDTPSTRKKFEAYNSTSDVNVRTEIINSSPSQEPTKAILFSQWTRMLDLLEAAIQQSNICYRRLDGSMSLAARDKAVSEFNTDPEVTVMLMSLKAGNLGLNMVAACHVILLDLWWNPTTEDQAIDRAHRIGQTRPVTVTRLTIKETVEDRILALQEEKRKMIASAFGEETSGGVVSRLSAEDLRYLFMG